MLIKNLIMMISGGVYSVKNGLNYGLLQKITKNIFCIFALSVLVSFIITSNHIFIRTKKLPVMVKFMTAYLCFSESREASSVLSHWSAALANHSVQSGVKSDRYIS